MRITVHTDRRAVLLIRNAYDEHWAATIDGGTTQLLVADGFLQAVAVPKGRHEVVLRYDDPWVTRGLAASGVAWAVLFLAWLASLLIPHRGSKHRTT
jgi:uncharacterized membrane protein YfhO